MRKKIVRPDMEEFRSAYERNRKIVLAGSEYCAICGMPLDKRKKFPDPMSPTVDHIIPIAKGGHPFSPDNLQAAHLICNQVKGSKTTIEMNGDLVEEKKIIGNRDLPLSRDWRSYS
jgi:5-methylcytosine-specific restriction endonuclease McrA